MNTQTHNTTASAQQTEAHPKANGLQTYLVTKLGEQRGTPRVWIEGQRLEQAGFSPAARYTVQIDRETRRLTLRVAATGERLVSRKERAGKVLPLIDICNGGLLSMFAGMDRLRVVFQDGALHILPLASEARKIERLERLRERLASGQPLAVGSVSTGVGVLSLAVHEGLKNGGLESSFAMACDIEADYLEQAQAKNPVWNNDTVMIAAPMQEIAFDPWALAKLPRLDVLEAGIPCTAHSTAGRAKKGLAIPEDDISVGHLVAALLSIVSATNPCSILVENVPAFMTSASFSILRNQLTEWGYQVSAVTLTGKEFNVMENRDRMALVAVTAGMEFDFADLQRPEPVTQRLGDLLEDVPADSPLWSKMEYLKAKQERDIEAGKGFMMQIFDESSTHISTVGKGYAKVRSTEPKIKHPTNPDLLRQLTPAEHAACKSINPVLIEGLSVTRAHEVLGQSILPAVFRAVAALLAKTMRDWFANSNNETPVFELVAA